MLALLVICLFQSALGKPQGYIPEGLTQPFQPQMDLPSMIPIEIWEKYESYIPREYYEIGKSDAIARSSFWQAALRHETGPYYELGQILTPGWFGFVPTSVQIENNYTVQLPGGGVGHYISGTFEGPDGIKGMFGSSSTAFAGRMSSTGMSWSTLAQPGQVQDEGLKSEERDQTASITQTENDRANQVANINQHGSNSQGGQSATINQFGSSQGQTATVNQGGHGGQGYQPGGSSSQAAGINQAANLGSQGGSYSHGSQAQNLGGGQYQGQFSSGSIYAQKPGYAQLSGQNTAQLSSGQQGLQATGQIQQTGNIRPGYGQLTGLNQAAGINQYQFQKPGYYPTGSAQSSASSSSSSMSQSSSYNQAQSSMQSTAGQLQSAGINSHQGTNIHNGYNTASGSNTGPNNYNGPNSGSVANLGGRPQDTVSIVGPSSPLTGSAGSIHVNA